MSGAKDTTSGHGRVRRESSRDGPDTFAFCLGREVCSGSRAAMPAPTATVRFYFNCRHYDALPRTSGRCQEPTFDRSFDNLVGQQQEVAGYRQPESFCGL
jgi:uncharacterized membrane protein